MKIAASSRAAAGDVIEKILRHCGLWEGPLRTNAGPRPPLQSSHHASTPYDLDFVPDTEFLESGYRESLAEATRESQLVLDPEFL